jgi:hypothetical protein
MGGFSPAWDLRPGSAGRYCPNLRLSGAQRPPGADRSGTAAYLHWVDPPQFDAVLEGDLVYVHDPVPPAYALLLGQVEQKRAHPRALVVYLAELGRTVVAEPDRLHGHPLQEQEHDACAWCRLHSQSARRHSVRRLLARHRGGADGSQ